jgi:hypothetical protein
MNNLTYRSHDLVSVSGYPVKYKGAGGVGVSKYNDN